MFVGLEPIRPHLWKLELWRLGALKENIKKNSVKLIIDNIFFCADVIGKKGVTECEIIFGNHPKKGAQLLALSASK